MQVTFTYRDTAGDFYVDAEVNGNRVYIVSISDDWKQDIPISDFNDDEQSLMRGLALREYHNIMNGDDDESVFDDEEAEYA
jgi:hypothetical protein